MPKCPACGSSRVYLSRLRNPLERLQHLMTKKRPFRCHSCEWRRWQSIQPHSSQEPDTEPDDLKSGRRRKPLTSAELDNLDPVERQLDPLERQP